MMEFQLVNKYLREPGKTFVAIRCQNPYTAYDRVLDGDLMAESDESLIETVKRNVIAELDPSGAIATMQKKVENTSQTTEENKEAVERIEKLTNIMILMAISTDGGMRQDLYNEIANLLPHLSQNVRYTNGDIVSMGYPFDTNAKWPKGTLTIFKFQMQESEGYTYKGQPLAEMLQKGVLTVVMPRID
ncbi:Phage protein [Streptococcus oralis]|uniref:Phage protein n=1 Tax=Streptococcus oralis TaxID=1303 RepID=A0A139NV48_STROR|nr:hypothetical protein [Streptococcus oralis]KXT79564.1 Phage protein [Streptococcus oralis]